MEDDKSAHLKMGSILLLQQPGVQQNNEISCKSTYLCSYLPKCSWMIMNIPPYSIEVIRIKFRGA